MCRRLSFKWTKVSTPCIRAAIWFFDPPWSASFSSHPGYLVGAASKRLSGNNERNLLVKIGSMKPIKRTETFVYTSRIACPIQNFPNWLEQSFGQKSECADFVFLSAEAIMSNVVAVMSIFMCFHSSQFFDHFICVFDVSRARGYLYNLVPRVLRLLYLLVSPPFHTSHRVVT